MALLSNIPVLLGSKGWPGELQLFLELTFVYRHFTRTLLSILYCSVPMKEWQVDGWKKRGRGLLGTWWMSHAHVRQPKHCFWLCYSHGFYLFPVSSASQAQQTIFSSWLCACGGLHGKAQIGKSLLTVAGRLKPGQSMLHLAMMKCGSHLRPHNWLDLQKHSFPSGMFGFAVA